MFSYLTAGESHGPALVGILDGIPAHLALDVGAVNDVLSRRQGGYGRGARMKIERDAVEFLAGVRGGETLGSPIAVLVRNRDHETPSVRALMESLTGSGPPLTNPRPGHADYAGALKYRQRDLRNVLERASARETAMRVCLGAICAQFLAALGITTRSYVNKSAASIRRSSTIGIRPTSKTATCAIRIQAWAKGMIAADRRRKSGAATRSAAGSSCASTDMPEGVGSNRQPSQRLDGILAGALMGMQTVKSRRDRLGSDVAIETGVASARYVRARRRARRAEQPRRRNRGRHE